MLGLPIVLLLFCSLVVSSPAGSYISGYYQTPDNLTTLYLEQSSPQNPIIDGWIDTLLGFPHFEPSGSYPLIGLVTPDLVSFSVAWQNRISDADALSSFVGPWSAGQLWLGFVFLHRNVTTVGKMHLIKVAAPTLSLFNARATN